MVFMSEESPWSFVDAGRFDFTVPHDMSSSAKNVAKLITNCGIVDRPTVRRVTRVKDKRCRLEFLRTPICIKDAEDL